MPSDQKRIPHDRIYKSIFSHPFAVRQLLHFVADETNVDAGWLAKFDFDTLEPVPTEHIAENLRSHQNDVCWRLHLRQGDDVRWAYLLVLIEFQSHVDFEMALRLRTYVDLLYRDIIRSWSKDVKTPRRFRASDRLPPILPVVLYNGRSRWTAAKSVEALLMAKGVPSDAPTDPLSFAGSSYLVFDLSHMSVGSVPSDVMSLLVAIETLPSYDDGSAILEAIFSVLPGNTLRELRHMIWMWFNQLIKPDAGDAVLLEFEAMERLHETGEFRTLLQDRVRAWREADREQGRVEGRSEGVELGRAEGVELGRAEGVELGRSEGVELGRAEGIEHERVLLQRQAERKFGAETAGRLSALLAGIVDPERLAHIGDWIIDCTSGDELIRRLERKI